MTRYHLCRCIHTIPRFGSCVLLHSTWARFQAREMILTKFDQYLKLFEVPTGHQMLIHYSLRTLKTLKCYREHQSHRSQARADQHTSKHHKRVNNPETTHPPDAPTLHHSLQVPPEMCRCMLQMPDHHAVRGSQKIAVLLDR